MAALKVLRDYWVLMAFLAAALFWLRDTYDEIARVPVEIRAIKRSVEALREEVQSDGREDRRAFGVGRIGDLSPVHGEQLVCHAADRIAAIVDSAGQWFMVERSTKGLQEIEGGQSYVFGAPDETDIAEGQARLLVQILMQCEGLVPSAQLPVAPAPTRDGAGSD